MLVLNVGAGQGHGFLAHLQRAMAEDNAQPEYVTAVAEEFDDERMAKGVRAAAHHLQASCLTEAFNQL